MEATALTTRNELQINGCYQKLAGHENVWEMKKSVYLSGKFQTDWKQTSLTGWYDQISENVYLRREKVKNSYDS